MIVDLDGRTDPLKSTKHVDIRQGTSSVLATTLQKTPFENPNQALGHSIGEATTKSKRVFHLSKERSSSSLRHSSSISSLSRIHKHRRARGHGIAVFSEQRRANLEKLVKSDSMSGLSHSIANLSTIKPAAVSDGPAMPSSSPRKRPNASTTERKWREETWAKPSNKDSTAQDVQMDGADPSDDASLALAAELQQFALEETAQKPLLSLPDATSTAAKDAEPLRDAALLAAQHANAKPLKFKPKAEAARNRASNSQSSPLEPTVIVDEDSESEWIYDTYIRESYPVSAASEPEDMALDGTQPGGEKVVSAENVGYLVIRQEDEEAWEEFMSEGDHSSDEERWEDEEDSNGMSLPGTTHLRFLFKGC